MPSVTAARGERAVRGVLERVVPAGGRALRVRLPRAAARPLPPTNPQAGPDPLDSSDTSRCETCRRLSCSVIQETR